MIHRLSYLTKFARARIAVAALARPCVAIAVAYALALQILLLSVMAASAAMTPVQADAAICYGNGNTNGNQQPPHSPSFADCTLSCAQGLSATAILPPDISPALVFATGDPLERNVMAAFVLSQRPSPKLAQGPPQTA